jgi:glycosyltransferase involved in cell wall biosynthesis
MDKINILQLICSAGFYGAERWVLALAKHINREHFTCDLAVTLEGVMNEPEIVKHYQGTCGDVFQLPMQNKFDFFVVNKLVDLIRERNIHIIHTHGYKSDILGILAAKKAGIKVVVTPHGFSTDIDFKLKTFIWIGCQMFRFADKVIPLSPQLMSDVRQFGVKEKNLSYVQNGVDLSEIESQKAILTNSLRVPNLKRIGFIGQMIGRKNIQHILDVFNVLADEDDSLRLYLLGDGDKRAELESYANKLKCIEKIEFLGFRDDRIEWLHSFDLFVMSSVLEGIPRCLMEAMAMGIPVVAYDIAGIDQLIKHSQTGYLAKLNDQEQLSQHWRTLLNNDALAETISNNACDFVYKHYSAHRMAREYAVIFTKMMQN